jgi:hypothetical protein
VMRTHGCVVLVGARFYDTRFLSVGFLLLNARFLRITHLAAFQATPETGDHPFCQSVYAAADLFLLRIDRNTS